MDGGRQSSQSGGGGEEQQEEEKEGDRKEGASYRWKPFVVRQRQHARRSAWSCRADRSTGFIDDDDEGEA